MDDNYLKNNFSILVEGKWSFFWCFLLLEITNIKKIHHVLVLRVDDASTNLIRVRSNRNCSESASKIISIVNSCELNFFSRIQLRQEISK